MTIIRGKLQVGEYKGNKLLVDFDDVFKYQGGRVDRDFLDKKIGLYFLVLGLLILVLPLVLLFFNSELIFSEFLNPSNLGYVLPYFSIFPFIISGYLKRNKDILGFNLENKDLSKVANLANSVVEIDDYMSEQILAAIDKIYFTNASNFMGAFSEYLISQYKVSQILEKRLGVDTKMLNTKLYNLFSSQPHSFDLVYQNFFVNIFFDAVILQYPKIDEVSILATMIKYYWGKALLELDVSELEVEALRNWIKNERMKSTYYAKWKVLSKLKPTGSINRAYTSKATPVLDTYGEDLTAKSARGKFDVSIGKELLMNEMIKVLIRQRGSSVALIGEPGVGKTQFLRYLATRMVVEDVPKTLQDNRLVVVNLNAMFTMAQSIEIFKQNLQALLEEVTYSRNIVLVLDDFEQILNIRSEGRLEVINVIINMVDKFNIKVIAASTIQDYSTHIKAIKPLAALFQIIRIDEPAKNLAMQIILDEAHDMESKYGITIQFDAVKRVIEYAPKIEFEKAMPLKGVHFLEEAVIEAKERGLGFVDNTIVDELITKKIGVKVGNISRDESEVLKNLETKMHDKVIGQDEAIRAVAAALRRSRSGMVSGRRPVASFLFFGPTGVGKTEVAKTIAETYYGDANLMIRLDMSEYHEEHNLARLIGYSDGSGNVVGGFLTEAVRTKPFSLILLDELEKANPKVLDIFLQILDDGRLTDGLGRQIDFTNTIIVATSNAASREIVDLIQAHKNYEEVVKETTPKLRDVYRVEFLNRFDKIIMFKPLLEHEVEEIAEIMLNGIRLRLKDKGMSIEWNEQTLKELAHKGYDSIYGARELRRVVQDEIEDKLASAIIDGKLVSGGVARFEGLDMEGEVT